jgi:hypothetical protein
MSQTPQQPRKSETTTESYLAIIATAEGGGDLTVRPGNVAGRYPKYAFPEHPTRELLEGIIVEVECGEEFLMKRKPKPPADNPPKE